MDGDIDCYLELKELARGQEQALYEEIKEELKRDRGYQGVGLYLSLIEEENDLVGMLEYVRESPEEIEKYSSRLLADYKEEVIRLWETKIRMAAASSRNRNAYQGACAILCRFKEVAGQVHQQEIISELSALYKRKPAYLDELGKI